MKHHVKVMAPRLPTPAQMDVTGGIGEVLARLGEARAESNRSLGDVAPARMTRPTTWVRYDVDVRFRLHRFAAHVLEHTIQCEKALAALGWQPTLSIADGIHRTVDWLQQNPWALEERIAA